MNAKDKKIAKLLTKALKRLGLFVDVWFEPNWSGDGDFAFTVELPRRIGDSPINMLFALYIVDYFTDVTVSICCGDITLQDLEHMHKIMATIKTKILDKINT